MNTACKLILIVFLGLMLATCQKELSVDLGGPADPGTPPATITASVVGRVTDQHGDPVSGASVKAGTSVATTNINGEFKLTNATFIDKAAYLTVNKAGYFQGSRTFRARQGHKHFVEIQLMPMTEVGSISGTTGGTINLGNGSSISLPANGVVVQSTGAAYTGAVKVSMTWIDPTSKDLFRQMPGDLRGIDASNNETGMETYGMLGVELNGASGEKLQVAAGKKASLKFPLPASLQGTAPATIALWSFNDTTGLWKQEGTATKSGNVYLADVSHFSWWNCDIPITTSAFFSATFVDQAGQPLTGFHVIIKRLTGAYSGAHGYTDSSGYVTGRIPANEPLQLIVDAPYPCYSILHTQNIGPFTVNSNNNLGNISVTITTASLATITGTAVNCAGLPVTSGYVEVHNGYTTHRSNITGGNFSVSFIKCAPGNVTYYVVDNAASQQSPPATIAISSGPTNVGAVNACGLSTLEFIDYTYDGTPVSLTKADSLVAYSTPGAANNFISGMTSAGDYISFNFHGTAPGTFPLAGLSIKVAGGTMQQFSAGQVAGINVVVTNYGTSSGSFIEGSFSGVVIDNASVSHPVQCSFRVKRQ